MLLYHLSKDKKNGGKHKIFLEVRFTGYKCLLRLYRVDIVSEIPSDQLLRIRLLKKQIF